MYPCLDTLVDESNYLLQSFGQHVTFGKLPTGTIHLGLLKWVQAATSKEGAQIVALRQTNPARVFAVVSRLYASMWSAGIVVVA